MKMTIPQFIDFSFHKINTKFPNASIRYQQNDDTHYIEVVPKVIYESGAFANLGWELDDIFESLGTGGILCFLTEDDLIKLNKPSKIYTPSPIQVNWMAKSSSTLNAVAEVETTYKSFHTLLTPLKFAGNYQYAMAA
mgnify:CR=1 FL=1